MYPRSGYFLVFYQVLTGLSAKIINEKELDILLIHVHSHNGMMVNELADDIINVAAKGSTGMLWIPRSVPRLPRNLQQTKAEIKIVRVFSYVDFIA